MKQKSDQPRCGRREMLMSIAGLALVSATFRADRGLDRPSGADAVAGHLLESLVIPVESARWLGRMRRADTGVYADLETVLERVAEGVGLSVRELAGASSREIRGAVQRAVRADFVLGRTIRLRGWMLSKIETDMLELAALAGAR